MGKVLQREKEKQPKHTFNRYAVMRKKPFQGVISLVMTFEYRFILHFFQKKAFYEVILLTPHNYLKVYKLLSPNLVQTFFT